MSFSQHLALQETVLAAAKEWDPESEGWLLIRVAEGEGYLLKAGNVHSLGVGDVISGHTKNIANIRSSSLNRMRLQMFTVRPELLGGVLTMNEMHLLGTGAEGFGADFLFVSGNTPFAVAAGEVFKMSSPESVTARGRRLQLWLEAVSRHQFWPKPKDESGERNMRKELRQLVGELSVEEVCSSSLPRLASRLGCSTRHFHRLFCEEFGEPLRSYQTSLKLARARHFLTESNAKIINVAEQSGYNHLGLFNLMFKKKFGMSPGKWRSHFRKQMPSKSVRGSTARILALILFVVFVAFGVYAQTNAPSGGTNQSPAVKAVSKFEVNNYEITGCTVLDSKKANSFFDAAKGREVDFEMIDKARISLEKAYRERGLVTVKVLIPPQKLTNATVKIQVVESHLSSVLVTGNRHYSSNNIMRKFPSLRTNTLLNQFILEKELDAANSGRDYTVTSVLGPGEKPETSSLSLRVKDAFPLHSRLELDNYNTPDSPALRANFNVQYDNLWDLDHQLGFQYGFSPEHMKTNQDNVVVPLDSPYIANYSAYYRMPLGRQGPVQEQVEANPGRFGYNESTHQFTAPGVTGVPELTVYASRATTDSGVETSPLHYIINQDLLIITSQTNGENITLNNDVGSTFRYPLQTIHDIDVTLSCGLDFKQFRLASFNNVQTVVTKYYTNSVQQRQSVSIPFSQDYPAQRVSLEYLPFNLGTSLIVPDPLGRNYINAMCKFSVLPFFSRGDAFAQARPGARAGYFDFNLNYNREQKIYKDYAATIRADAQWTYTPLISNEQFALGGSGSVRGYHEGEVYGDSGWDVSIEPHTPYYRLASLGSEANGVDVRCRFSAFLDYGQVYLLQNGGSFALSGAGIGAAFSLGSHFGAQFQLARTLLNSPLIKAGSSDFRFSLSGQF